jgi:hypothetical protein
LEGQTAPTTDADRPPSVDAHPPRIGLVTDGGRTVK